jgi:hypothetical protein
MAPGDVCEVGIEDTGLLRNAVIQDCSDGRYTTLQKD